MSDPTSRNRYCLAGAIALVLLSVLELASFFGLRIHDRSMYLPGRLLEIDGERCKSELGWIQASYDRDLGWDNGAVIRGFKLSDKAAVSGAFASAYGDSFTFCDGVRDDQTWESLFEAEYGRRILNMGFDRAGTDQALLKMVKYYHRHPTKVVILGFHPRFILRNVTAVSSFAAVPSQRAVAFLPVFKPRFFERKGKLVLLPSPVKRKEDLESFCSKEKLLRVAKNDYLYNYYRDRYGIDIVQGRRFPSLLEVGHILFGFLKYGADPLDYRYYMRHEHQEPFRVLEQSIGLFKKLSKQYGFEPFVILYGALAEMQDPTINEHLVRYLDRVYHIHFLDVPRVLWEPIQSGSMTYEEAFSPVGKNRGTYYSAMANGMIAHALGLELLKAGLLK